MIPILSRINPIPRIDAYYNIVLHLRLVLPKGLLPVDLSVKIFKASYLIQFFPPYITCPS